MTAFLVLGVGPIGGIIGGRLAAAGHDVTFADTDHETVSALRDQGLRLQLPDGDQTLAVTAMHPDEIERRYDVVLLAVPTSATDAALPTAQARLAEGGMVVSLQNGLSAQRLADALGAESTAGCAIRLGSRRIAPGVYATGVRGHLSLGHWRRPATPALERLVTTLDAVIDTDLSVNIEAELWGKLCHTSMVYFECLDDASLVSTLESPVARELFLELLAEVVGVAEASGLRIPPMADFAPDDFSPRHSLEHRERALDEWIPRMDPNSRKGAFRRIREGGRTDVDEVLGVVVEQGRQRSMPVAVAAALQALVHAVEDGLPMDHRNYRKLARSSAG